jgi:hypothetical protein
MKTFSVPGTQIEFVVKTNRFGQWHLSVWVGSSVLMGSAYGTLPLPSDEELVRTGQDLYGRERAWEIAELCPSGVLPLAAAAEQEVA